MLLILPIRPAAQREVLPTRMFVRPTRRRILSVVRVRALVPMVPAIMALQRM